MEAEVHATNTVLKALLFTDLVGSTDLKRRLGDAAGADVISKHDAVARECVAEFGGSDLKDTGDGFLATFDVPSNAVKCALSFQRRIAELESPEPLRLRMGVHLGEIVRVKEGESDGEDKLVGLAVDTAARIMGLAQGGQILLSRGAFDSSRQQILESPDGSALQWLAHGFYHFKGIDDPLEVFEVGVEGVSVLGPPPDSEKAKRGLAPGVEDTLGWRPAVGLTVPRREHWVLQEQLGEGGYGEVWLAGHDKTKKNRVFKFCFDPERVRGLKREVVLFRLLKESLGDRDDIVQIVDWEFERPPYYLESEYTEAGDLTAWAEGQGGIGAVGLETRIELIAQTAVALGAAHSAGVLHKDIKPSNILIAKGAETGKPMARLTDFGIGLVTSREALQAKGITMAGLTETLLSGSGSSSTHTSGTRLYMAPEVIEGKPPTALSDVYALGVVLYQTVIGDFSRAVAPGWERDVEDEILREDIGACVDGIPERRLESAALLAERLRNLGERRGRRARARRRKSVAWASVAVLVAAISVVSFIRSSHQRDQAREAREETLPRVMELIEAQDYIAAFDLAREAEPHLINDSLLEQLWPQMSVELSVLTTPEGADVYYKPYAEVDGVWRAIGRSPIDKIKLPRGAFRFLVEKEAYETIEVARFVTAVNHVLSPRMESLTFRLDERESLPEGMISAQGGFYGTVPLGGTPPFVPRGIAPYIIDQHEVTNREFKEFVGAGGYENSKFWEHDFSKDGQELSWEEAMTQFRDSTDEPGPANWEAGLYPEGQDDYPVGGVSWYEAAAYAAYRGKSLPTIYHWIVAALDKNETIAAMAPSIVALSNFGGGGPAPVAQYSGIGITGAYDMAGNVREWCWNERGEHRINLGGGSGDAAWMFTLLHAQSPWDRLPINGFRCVKYAEEAGPSAALAAPLDVPSVDYTKIDPISADAFQVYLDRFLYEKVPIVPVISRPERQPEGWTRETVTIDTAYGGESLIIHLALPKNAAPPYQAVIALFGLQILAPQAFDETYFDAYRHLINSGRAFIIPVFSGTFERSDGQSTARLFNALTSFDLIVEWGKDLGRTIDYLEDRQDIDANRLAYLGSSMGSAAAICVPLLAAEKRIRVAVLEVGGFSPSTGVRAAEVTVAFVERLKTPLMLLGGRYDYVYPLETHQKPFIARLGTREEDKRHRVFDTGHWASNLAVHRNDVIQERQDWLDRYLGPVELIATSATSLSGRSGGESR